MDISKQFTKSEITELQRSEIHPSSYNPRSISKEGRAQLKKSIKLYGVVGGIIVNKQTGYTIVGGHQKVDILDELNKYDIKTKENDYKLRVEVIDVDLKTEKELNIMLNNPAAQGYWDYDALRELVPDIDYKNAGLTEEDLSMIGVDYFFKSEGEEETTQAIEDMMQPLRDEHDAEMNARKLEREAVAEAERQAKIDHMKDVKQQVKEQAIEKAQDMDAYLMLSFDSFESKKAFCQRLGFDPYDKFIKGEVLDQKVEVIYDE